MAGLRVLLKICLMMVSRSIAMEIALADLGSA